jgi:hypothetical protein
MPRSPAVSPAVSRFAPLTRAAQGADGGRRTVAVFRVGDAQIDVDAVEPNELAVRVRQGDRHLLHVVGFEPAGHWLREAWRLVSAAESSSIGDDLEMRTPLLTSNGVRSLALKHVVRAGVLHFELCIADRERCDAAVIPLDRAVVRALLAALQSLVSPGHRS